MTTSRIVTALPALVMLAAGAVLLLWWIRHRGDE
jgi:hypothetical protein